MTFAVEDWVTGVTVSGKRITGEYDGGRGHYAVDLNEAVVIEYPEGFAHGVLRVVVESTLEHVTDR